ncbi:Rpusd1 [Symbiodinium necroappetens]|uniref:Rpusd1 protein n=1 Tax=Symbiodinium necroappetens TaxID=1628268 RepID=A0A813B7F1_9DINO|nr:Rpusd1 [Symbiodinium necroappetens]
MQGVVPDRSSAKDLMRHVVVLAQMVWLSGAVRTNDSQKDLTQMESAYGDVNEIKGLKDMTLGDARKALSRPNAEAERALDQLEHLMKKIAYSRENTNLWKMPLAQAVQTRGNDGKTLLHDASEGAWPGDLVLKALVLLGLDVNSRDALGRTPLCVAAASCPTSSNRLLSIKALIALGADKHIACNGRIPGEAAQFAMAHFGRYAQIRERCRQVVLFFQHGY